MYLPPCKSFLKKRFKNFSNNSTAQMWALMNTYFDHEFYYDSNPDLHENYKKNEYDGLWSHYILNGWEEGRFPFDVQVDEIFYNENYPDASLFNGTAQEHFVKHGYKEGRLPYLFTLNLQDYRKKLFIINPNGELPSNNKEMYQHYKDAGYHLLII